MITSPATDPPFSPMLMLCVSDFSFTLQCCVGIRYRQVQSTEDGDELAIINVRYNGGPRSAEM